MIPLLKLKNLCKEYKRGEKIFKAADDINLEIFSGDFVNIIGRSGSGKSTLLNMAAGLLTPTSGEIEFEGEKFSLKDDYQLSKIRNEKIGFIPQGASALPNLDILENILLPFYLRPKNIKSENNPEETANNLLEKFGIQNLADSYPSELSGGELRRALIIRALINGPKIIIADEPTSDLDIESSKNIMEIFKELNNEGLTVLLVSHDLETLKYGNKIFTMNAGILTPGNNLAP